MSDLFFHRPLIAGMGYKPGTAFQICLKVLNETGDELSLALDNSAGAHEIAWRGDLRVFVASGDDNQEAIEPITNPTPLDLLKVLATHLGYYITPIATPEPWVRGNS